MSLACLSKQICGGELSPVVGTVRVQEGQGTSECISCGDKYPCLTPPLTSSARKDIVSIDYTKRKASMKKHRQYVSCVCVRLSLSIYIYMCVCPYGAPTGVTIVKLTVATWFVLCGGPFWWSSATSAEGEARVSPTGTLHSWSWNAFLDPTVYICWFLIPILDPGTPLKVIGSVVRFKWTKFQFYISNGEPFHRF